jgi:HEAT repeat protein
MFQRTLLLSATLLIVGCQAAPSSLPGEPPTAASQPAFRAMRDRAVEQILASAQGDDPFLRANAIEAAQNLPDRVVPLVQLGLSDAHPAPRFVALVTIGKLRLKSLAVGLGRFDDDPSESVRAAALYARRACGQKVDLSPMAGFLVSPDPEVRGNTAMVLGLLGDKSAIPMLKDLTKVSMPRASAARSAIVRIQVAEALVRLGDDSALAALRAGAYAQLDEVRVLSVQMLGRAGDKAMQWALLDMLKQPPVELQLAAAEALARFGHLNGLEIALTSAASDLATARGQAALTLGLFPDERATAALATLQGDAQEGVRLAAAAAVVGAGRKR